MSNTRHARAGETLSDERYLSSPEFAELHGVNAVAVAARAALVPDPALRELLWFLQGSSLQPGGLKKVARGLVEMFPRRVQTQETEAARFARQQARLAKQAAVAQWLRGGADGRAPSTEAPSKMKPQHPDGTVSRLHRFLVDLCINPRMTLSDGTAGKVERIRVLDEFPQLDGDEIIRAAADDFAEVISALLEYKARVERAVIDDFVLTDNGKILWDAIDYSRQTRGIVLVEGREGRGKTEAASAYCSAHLGLCRFVSLQALTSKTSMFQVLGKAVGVACGPTRKCVEMQGRVEDVLQRSHLQLVIDEAHWAFNQARRVYSRPELIDWIGTLSNYRVPVVLVSTPQFIECVVRAVDQVGWNWHQFKRRVKRFPKFSQSTSEEDMRRVAKKLLPGASSQMVEAAINFATLLGRDLSGLGDLAKEVDLITNAERKATTADLRRAFDNLAPSGALFAQVEERIDALKKKKGQRQEQRQQQLGQLQEQQDSRCEKLPALVIERGHARSIEPALKEN